jgi:hypothetical protein
LKVRSNIKYKDGKFVYLLKKICTGSGHYKESKKYLINNWANIYVKYYTKFNQYGTCDQNGMTGVLTPFGSWSRINQFNTHPSCNEYISQYLNQQLSNDFIAKGIDELDGRQIDLIKFDKTNTTVEYAFSELEKYFFWLNYYGDKIFKDQNNLTDNDFLSILIDKAISTMSAGTFAELCVEYLFKSKLIKYNVYRSSTIKGNKDDFNGVDLYTTEKDNESAVKKYQVKSVKVYGGNTIYNPINTKFYNQMGIDYLTIAEMNIHYTPSEITVNPTRMLFFKMDPNLFTEQKHLNSGDTYSFDPKSIIMEEPISQIFKSKIFYDFFMYCTKHGLQFLMDVDDTTSATYDENMKSVSLKLPTDDKTYDDQPIIDVWKEIINKIETGTNRENSLKDLEKFHK